ncbi:hypothetical protein PQ610_00815 [Tardisphaera miroshnichenkoae]
MNMHDDSAQGSTQGLFKVLLQVLAEPQLAFQEAKKRTTLTLALIPIFLGSLLGLSNEVVLFAKVFVFTSPPYGLQGPSFLSTVIWQVPPQVYFYYFFDAFIFEFFYAVFDFIVVWILLRFLARRHGSGFSAGLLMAFSFISLMPIVVTGAVSLILIALLPTVVVSTTANAAVNSIFEASLYYRGWEALGWAGEIWAGVLTAISGKALTDLSNGEVATLAIASALLVALRIYYLF